MAKGYGRAAIACRMGVSERVVAMYLSQMRLHLRRDPPPGYITLREAARLAGVTEDCIRLGERIGELRFVRVGHLVYTTPEWVQIWVNNDPYRKRAREMGRKLMEFVGDHPILGQQSPSAPQPPDRPPRQ